MTSNNIGCLMNIVKSAINVAINLIPFVDVIIAEFVGRYFATNVVVKRFMEK